MINQGASIPVHALLETYSVLTGFPPPHRAAPTVVQTWLDARFEHVLEPPGVDRHRELIRRLADAGRNGGAIYDGLVGINVHAAGGVLVTADERALPIYDLLEVDVRMLPVAR